MPASQTRAPPKQVGAAGTLIGAARLSFAQPNPHPARRPAPLQVLAARKLHAYCCHSGRPVEAAIAAAGGVHMLLIMLDSLDRNLRDLCTRILTDLAADDRVRCERGRGCARWRGGAGSYSCSCSCLACVAAQRVGPAVHACTPALRRTAGKPLRRFLCLAGCQSRLGTPPRRPTCACTHTLPAVAPTPRCSAEILSAPGGTAKVIQLMYRGILDGQASAGRFLELLAGSKDEAVQARAAT